MFLSDNDINPTNFRHRRRELKAEQQRKIEAAAKTCSHCGFKPTQEQLAKKFSITRSTVAKILAGTLFIPEDHEHWNSGVKELDELDY